MIVFTPERGAIHFGDVGVSAFTEPRRIELSYADEIEMQAGDLFVIETPGGGGYGAPE